MNRMQISNRTVVRTLDKSEFLLILHKNISCDPSSELSHRDGSDEGSHHIISMRNKKNNNQILPLI